MALSPEQLLAAYQQGYFPMASSRHAASIRWYSADPRAVIPLDDHFNIPRGLRRSLAKTPFEHRINHAFSDVITACAERDDTWINDTIIQAYTRLHQAGHAHSVESWQDGRLVGGLYGVSIGGAFCGESMFSRVSDASKAALVHLVRHLRQRGFTLLDSQIANPHLVQFGMEEIPLTDYLARLHQALMLPVYFEDAAA